MKIILCLCITMLCLNLQKNDTLRKSEVKIKYKDSLAKAVNLRQPNVYFQDQENLDQYDKAMTVNQYNGLVQDNNEHFDDGQITFYTSYYNHLQNMLKHLDLTKNYSVGNPNMTKYDLQNALPLFATQVWEEKLYDVNKFHYAVQDLFKGVKLCDCDPKETMCECTLNKEGIVLPTIIPQIEEKNVTALTSNDKVYGTKMMADYKQPDSVVKFDKKLFASYGTNKSKKKKTRDGSKPASVSNLNQAQNATAYKNPSVLVDMLVKDETEAKEKTKLQNGRQYRKKLSLGQPAIEESEQRQPDLKSKKDLTKKKEYHELDNDYQLPELNENDQHLLEKYEALQNKKEKLMKRLDALVQAENALDSEEQAALFETSDETKEQNSNENQSNRKNLRFKQFNFDNVQPLSTSEKEAQDLQQNNNDNKQEQLTAAEKTMTMDGDETTTNPSTTPRDSEPMNFMKDIMAKDTQLLPIKIMTINVNDPLTIPDEGQFDNQPKKKSKPCKSKRKKSEDFGIPTLKINKKDKSEKSARRRRRR